MKKITFASALVAVMLLGGCSGNSTTKEATAKANAVSNSAVETAKAKATQAVEATKEAAKAAVDAAKEKVAEATEAAKAKATEALETTKAKAAEVAQVAKDKAAEALEEAKTKTAATAEAVKEKTSEIVEKVSSSDPAKGKALFAKCAGCHGADGRTKALGKSDPIAGISSEAIAADLTGYRAGTLNKHGMGSLMKGQAASLSDEDIQALSDYISALK